MNAPPRSQLGRSALLVHGLMWLAVAACFGLAAWLRQEKEALTCLVLGVTTAVVLQMWSLALATRALRKGENGLWPQWVWTLCLLEFSTCSVFLAMQGTTNHEIELVWWLNYYGITIAFPVLCVVVLVAAAFTSWLIERDERRSGMKWTRRLRWTYRLTCFTAIASLNTLLFMPPILFLFSLNASKFYFDGQPNTSWHAEFVRVTPVFVADKASALVSYSRNKKAVILYGLALASGRVSKSRLVAELQSSNEWYVCQALKGLLTADHTAAVDAAHQICVSARFKKVLSVVQQTAVTLVMAHGTDEQIMDLLASVENASGRSSYLSFLVNMAGGTRRPAILAELARLAVTNTPYRQELLISLARNGSSAVIESVWMKGLDDPSDTQIGELLNHADVIHDESVRTRFFLAALRHARPAIRKSSILRLAQILKPRGIAERSPLLVRQIVEMLEDANLEVQRSAYLSVNEILDRSSIYLATRGPQISENEKAEREKIRAAAQQWLGKHP